MDLPVFRAYPFPLPRAQARHMRGHSLANLLTTVAVVGLVTGGLPAVQDMVREQRQIAHVYQLFGDLQLARSEAIKRSAQMTLCQSRDGAACSGDSDWQSGWILFVDANENEAVDAGETVIRTGQALAGGITLGYGTGYRYVYYKPDGAAWPNATFTFCDARGATGARAIIVSNSGRARISNKASDGGTLTCR